MAHDPIGVFRCCGCAKTFRHEPGPQVTCPFCAHIYAVWIDYERFKKRREARLAREGR